jgi:hypothetical protein
MLKNTRPPEWLTELSSNLRNRNVKIQILLFCSARPFFSVVEPTRRQHSLGLFTTNSQTFSA